MESCAESMGVMEQLDAGKSLHPLRVNISKEQLLDKLLFFVKAALEYAFGMHIGYVVGWLTGFYAGEFHVEHFEPMYLEDLSRLSYWRLVPSEFAGKGAVIGLAAGAIVIAIINAKLLNQRIVSLYEKGTTSPDDIARVLGKSPGQIERRISKLVEKGRIRQKTILAEGLSTRKAGTC
ncbi:MAG: winged helix-turn-helix domain-containing protein [Phycisphaerales bacterium]|jgi:hypothetical protein